MKPIEFVCGQNWVDQAENNRRDYHPTLASNANENGWDMLSWARSWIQSPEGYDVWHGRWVEMMRAQISTQNVMLR